MNMTSSPQTHYPLLSNPGHALNAILYHLTAPIPSPASSNASARLNAIRPCFSLCSSSISPSHPRSVQKVAMSKGRSRRNIMSVRSSLFAGQHDNQTTRQPKAVLNWLSTKIGKSEGKRQETHHFTPSFTSSPSCHTSSLNTAAVPIVGCDFASTFPSTAPSSEAEQRKRVAPPADIGTVFKYTLSVMKDCESKDARRRPSVWRENLPPSPFQILCSSRIGKNGKEGE